MTHNKNQNQVPFVIFLKKDFKGARNLVIRTMIRTHQ